MYEMSDHSNIMVVVLPFSLSYNLHWAVQSCSVYNVTCGIELDIEFIIIGKGRIVPSLKLQGGREDLWYLIYNNVIMCVHLHMKVMR